MKTLHTIEWLIHPDNNEVVDVGVKSTKMAFPYPSEIGTGYTEHIELLDEIKVIQNVHQFTGEDRPDKIPLGIFEAQCPSTALPIFYPNVGGQSDVPRNVLLGQLFHQ